MWACGLSLWMHHWLSHVFDGRQGSSIRAVCHGCLLDTLRSTRVPPSTTGPSSLVRGEVTNCSAHMARTLSRHTFF